MSMAVLLILAIAAFLAGLGGSYLGVGGGVFLIPFMTLALSVNIKVAIATSLIGVIATSSGAASVYVRDHLTNLRLAMFLEVATTLGAIAGALVGLGAPDFYLYLVFGVVVLYAATTMVRVRERVHLLFARLGRSRPRGHGDHRRVLRHELGRAAPRACEILERAVRVRPLPHHPRDRDAREVVLPGGPALITARAGLRIVQQRGSHLRPAGGGETAGTNPPHH